MNGGCDMKWKTSKDFLRFSSPRNMDRNKIWEVSVVIFVFLWVFYYQIRRRLCFRKINNDERISIFLMFAKSHHFKLIKKDNSTALCVTGLLVEQIKINKKWEKSWVDFSAAAVGCVDYDELPMFTSVRWCEEDKI